MNTKSNWVEPAWADDFFIAPIAEVWRALTDPELIVQWLGDPKLYHMTRVKHELRPGGSVFYGWTSMVEKFAQLIEQQQIKE